MNYEVLEKSRNSSTEDKDTTKSLDNSSMLSLNDFITSITIPPPPSFPSLSPISSPLPPPPPPLSHPSPLPLLPPFLHPLSPQTPPSAIATNRKEISSTKSTVDIKEKSYIHDEKAGGKCNRLSPDVENQVTFNLRSKYATAAETLQELLISRRPSFLSSFDGLKCGNHEIEKDTILEEDFVKMITPSPPPSPQLLTTSITTIHQLRGCRPAIETNQSNNHLHIDTNTDSLINQKLKLDVSHVSMQRPNVPPPPPPLSPLSLSPPSGLLSSLLPPLPTNRSTRQSLIPRSPSSPPLDHHHHHHSSIVCRNDVIEDTSNDVVDWWSSIAFCEKRDDRIPTEKYLPTLETNEMFRKQRDSSTKTPPIPPPRRMITTSSSSSMMNRSSPRRVSFEQVPSSSSSNEFDGPPSTAGLRGRKSGRMEASIPQSSSLTRLVNVATNWTCNGGYHQQQQQQQQRTLIAQIRPNALRSSSASAFQNIVVQDNDHNYCDASPVAVADADMAPAAAAVGLAGRTFRSGSFGDASSSTISNTSSLLSSLKTRLKSYWSPSTAKRKIIITSISSNNNNNNNNNSSHLQRPLATPPMMTTWDYAIENSEGNPIISDSKRKASKQCHHDDSVTLVDRIFVRNENVNDRLNDHKNMTSFNTFTGKD